MPNKKSPVVQLEAKTGRLMAVVAMLLLILLSGLSGCTSKMWNDARITKVIDGKDTIRSMLMSPDGKLVILGDRYHYLFSPQKYNNYLITKRMLNDFRKHYRANFQNCQMSHINQMVTCEVALMMDVSSFTAEQKAQATALDFFPPNSPYHRLDISKKLATDLTNNLPKRAEGQQHSSSINNIWIAESTVKGKFYTGNAKVTQAAKQLNQSYTINVTEKMDGMDPNKAALATLASPVTLLADGVVGIGLVALLSIPGMDICFVCW